MVLSGMSTTWVLLRGLVRESRHWGPFVPALARCLPQARLVALDLPGNGALHQQRSPSTVAGMVEAYRAQAQAQGLRPPYHVCAVSMGAMVAVQWAHSYPHEIAAQVLINTSMRPFSPVTQRLQMRNWPTILRLALWSTPVQWEAAVLRMTTARPHPEVLAQWVHWHQTCPVSKMNALRQLWAAARFRAPPVPPGSPQVPTLLLASTRDPLVSVRCSQALAQAWQLPLLQHPSAGHDLTLDDPAWVAEAVMAWTEGF